MKSLFEKKIIILLFVFLPLFSADARQSYPETIAGLKTVYIKEIKAQKRYMAFSEKAKKENYPNISRLFAAISISESIHAKNMKNVILSLGAGVTEPESPEPEISDTKTNLGIALGAELQDMDHVYPGILEKIRPEGNAEAMRAITYALESEKQHRHIIELIKSATETDLFFGMLAGTMESKSSKSFVCMICGSTVMELPEDKCPICGNPATNYEEGP